MTIRTQILLFVLVFMSGMGIHSLIEAPSLNEIVNILLPALATLLAAFFGASYAFKLNTQENAEETRQKNVASINHIVFSLSRMQNTLTVYERDFVQPHRGDPARFLSMPPTLMLPRNEVAINLDSGSFLLQSKEPNLLGKVVVAVSKFDSVLSAINSRSELHLLVIQPKLHAAGLTEGMSFSSELIKGILGELDHTKLIMGTDQIIEHLDEAIPYLNEVAEELHSIGKELFPGSQIIRFRSAPEFNQKNDS
ncbi:MAG: hypothetical protein SH820_14900 [Xanthomonadales bacterium]|nr:hypothetical protein [Xanthomonadales bacterium]